MYAKGFFHKNNRFYPKKKCNEKVISFLVGLGKVAKYSFNIFGFNDVKELVSIW